MTRLSRATAIENAIEEILTGGTKIVSFQHGSEYFHNVLIGSKRAHEGLKNQTLYGETIHNRAVATLLDGRKTFAGIMNNRNHQIGLFSLDCVTNFSYLRPDHYYEKAKPTRWQKIKWWFVQKFVL